LLFCSQSWAQETPKKESKSQVVSKKSTSTKTKKKTKAQAKTPAKVKINTQAKQNTQVKKRASIQKSKVVTKAVKKPIKKAVIKKNSQTRLQVKFDETRKGLTFTFNTSNQSPLNLNSFSVDLDPRNQKRLIIKVDGISTKRVWTKRGKAKKSSWVSNKIKRALIYPSKSSLRSTLKVLMKTKIPKSVFKKRTLTTKNDKTIVFLPWTGSKSIQKKSLTKVQADVSESTNVVSTRSTESGDIKTTPVSDTTQSDKEKSSDPESLFKFHEQPQSPTSIGPIYQEVALEHLAQAQKTETIPRILALPFLNGKTLTLKYSTQLSTALLDNEFIQRNDLIWISQDQIREQALHLLDGETDLSKKTNELKALADFVGADFILAGSLSEDLQQSSFIRMNTQLISTSDLTLVHERDYRLSRALIAQGVEESIYPIYRETSIWRSILFPGLGHVYRHKKVKGWTYLTAATAFLISATASSIAGWNATSDYEDPSRQIYTAHRRQDANAHYDRANLLWIGLATLWATSVVDNYFEAQDDVKMDLHQLGSEFKQQR
jgi:hypothetical protein